MKNTELALTKEAILAEGIEIKVTQTDVIDALVEEQLAAYQAKVDKLNEEAQALKTELRLIHEAAEKVIVDKFTAEGKFKGMTIDYIGHDLKYNSYKSHEIYCITKQEKNNSGTYSYSYRGSSVYVDAPSLLVTVKVLKTVNGITLIGLISEKISIEYSADFIARIKKQNKKIEDFLKTVPEKISEREISKRIKNQFTKEILKSSSKEFKQKLKLGFSMDL